MEKNRLPKLELDGFTSTENRREPASWKNRAAVLADRIRTPIKRMRTRPESAAAAEPQHIDVTYKRLLIKTGICAVIAITILAISSIDSPVTNSITEAIDDAVNHEFDIDEDIGKLKFVQSLTDETESVFSAAVVAPVEGDIVTEYGESGSKGVRIAPVDSEVVSIAKGTVTAVGTIDDMGYVKIVLDAGETTVFYNISPIAQVDDIVYAGQTIGDVMGDYLYFEMTSGGEYIDPLAYIEQRAALVVQ